MTRLRKLMLDELQRRNYAPSTIHNYIHAIEDFARYFGRSPYYLGPNHIRQYQAHLFRDRKLLAQTVRVRTAALRFLFVKTLKRPYLHEQIPFPKRPRMFSEGDGSPSGNNVYRSWCDDKSSNYGISGRSEARTPPISGIVMAGVTRNPLSCGA